VAKLASILIIKIEVRALKPPVLHLPPLCAISLGNEPVNAFEQAFDRLQVLNVDFWISCRIIIILMKKSGDA